MFRFITPLFLISSLTLSAQCTSNSSLNASGGANNSSLGSISWGGMTNIGSSDNGYCSAGSLLGILASANTQYLYVTGFGFNLPSSATICGMQVSVERNASGLLIGSSVTDNSVKIVKNGTIMGTEHASGTAWGGSDATALYGSNADAWGTTWTYADINNASFGIAISARMNAGLASLFLSANIDNIRITVYYTDITLPIELMTFSGSSKEHSVEVRWSTATETNNEHFSLQKLDDTAWTQVAMCAGAGTSTQTHSYALHDLNPAAINYYRLVQYDYNGSYAVSEIIAVEHAQPVTQQLHLFPQPATDHVLITGGELITRTDVFTSEGTLVQSSSFADGNSSVDINTSGMRSGMYIVHVYFQSGAVVAERLLIF